MYFSSSKLVGQKSEEKSKLLGYHLALLNLLALCSYGKKELAEISSQALLSVETCLEILANPELEYSIKGAYARFLDEVRASFSRN
jgi:hypothetical protein